MIAATGSEKPARGSHARLFVCAVSARRLRRLLFDSEEYWRQWPAPSSRE